MSIISFVHDYLKLFHSAPKMRAENVPPADIARGGFTGLFVRHTGDWTEGSGQGPMKKLDSSELMLLKIPILRVTDQSTQTTRHVKSDAQRAIEEQHFALNNNNTYLKTVW